MTPLLAILLLLPSPAPPEAKARVFNVYANKEMASPTWRSFPLRRSLLWKGHRNLLYCDDPSCPYCSGPVWGRQATPQPKERP